ncbi:protein RDR1 [Aspergillus terreus]|uniref:Protein RDR1 n=1 Tax=Aspergillus terreus TaxID=33178 RepID=A0A5M3YUN0_ASPTE|nr:hypothetical protein ATETN484_0004048900 [Aspergillus terreus]GFF13378.1 protein RDR1 [Aspergillus terreus]
MSFAPAQYKRKRSRVACEPCRERKRKCDGDIPCSTCTSWGYDCHQRRTKYATPGAVAQSASSPIETPHIPTTSHARDFTESLEANSGAAFVRKIALKVDPANAPKLNLFSWNIGTRKLPSGLGTVSVVPIVDLVSLAKMQSLANVYFTKVDPCYGFIDSAVFFARLDARWRSSSPNDTYDSVLAGVAALGLLFSERSIKITEPRTSLAGRRNSMGSSSGLLAHDVSAISGLDSKFYLDSSNRSGKAASGVTKPDREPGDFTVEILSLLDVSASLSPEKENNDNDLRVALLRTLNGNHTQPPSILGQCNLVLCLLRRLRMTNITASSETMMQILNLFGRALDSARTMLATCCPWHHVANVPFQMITVLLEMDTSPALGILPNALQTLKLVASTYDTDTMREAYSTARLLITLYQRRRSEDTKLLSHLLNDHNQDAASAPLHRQIVPNPDEVSWLEGLVADVPTLQGVDLYEFLQADMARLSQDSEIL